MKITIRTRTLRTGSRSIYLDFYDKGKRWNEYLNLFLIPDDEPDAKRLNEAAMAKANTIKSKRMLGIEEETNDDEQSELPKRVFADWLADHIEGILVLGQADAEDLHLIAGVGAVAGLCRIHIP